MGEQRFDHMRVVGDAQLVGDGDKQRVGRRDSVVFPELLDQGIRLGRIATAEDRPSSLVDESDLVFFFTPGSEIASVAIVRQCNDAATDRDPRLASVAGEHFRQSNFPNISN